MTLHRDRLFALLVITACIFVYYQNIWVRSIGSTDSIVDRPTDTVRWGASIDLYGATWSLRPINFPKVQSDDTFSLPENGRWVGYLFERSINGARSLDWTNHPDCRAYMVDDSSRQWRNVEASLIIQQWEDSNNYVNACAIGAQGRELVVLRVVPADVHIVGVQVAFVEGDGSTRIVRFSTG